MGLLASLFTVANRLHIIQRAGPEENAQATPAVKIQTRTLTLAELMSEIRQEDVRALADAPAELTVPLEKVCEAAGVKPLPNQWSVDHLRDVLRGPKYASLSRDATQRELLEQLAAEKVGVEELVKDAVARDQAIDAFEQFVRGKLESRSSARESRIAAIQSQIHDLQNEAAELSREGEAETGQWKQWRGKKLAYEKELAWAIGFLFDRPVITTDDAP